MLADIDDTVCMALRQTEHPIWPLFDLQVRTPSLTLRYTDDALATELAQLAAAGIHDDDFMPFSIPWSDLDSPQLERGAMQFHWRSRAETTPSTWRLLFAVLVDGRPVGMSDVFATDFPQLRQFETGSWLGREFQGQGIGKEMRAASLHLAFEGLGAEYGLTGAWHDNGPSLGVTRSLGYEPVGQRRALRRASPDEIHLYRMSRQHWTTIRRDDISIHGLEPCLELLGLS
jgi:RimJ/RimL family protein N-acetyltransferase